MARAPNQKADEARKLFEKGLKLKEIAAQLNVPEGTVRRWKNTYEWDKKRSDRKSERSDKKSERSDRKKVASREIKTRRGTEEPDRRETRMRLRQESLKLSFLIC